MFHNNTFKLGLVWFFTGRRYFDEIYLWPSAIISDYHRWTKVLSTPPLCNILHPRVESRESIIRGHVFFANNLRLWSWFDLSVIENWFLNVFLYISCFLIWIILEKHVSANYRFPRISDTLVYKLLNRNSREIICYDFIMWPPFCMKKKKTL